MCNMKLIDNDALKFDLPNHSPLILLKKEVTNKTENCQLTLKVAVKIMIKKLKASPRMARRVILAALSISTVIVLWFLLPLPSALTVTSVTTCEETLSLKNRTKPVLHFVTVINGGMGSSFPQLTRYKYLKFCS